MAKLLAFTVVAFDFLYFRRLNEMFLYLKIQNLQQNRGWICRALILLSALLGFSDHISTILRNLKAFTLYFRV